MEFYPLDLPGPMLLQPHRFGDDRGYFSEIFRADLFGEKVGPVDFVQENESLSARVGTVRGLHFQIAPFAQGKLVRCLAGRIFDVVVDIRRGSPAFGRWTSVELSAREGKQFWIPPGFAHGFCTLEPDSIVCYKVTSYYSAENDRGILWDDPALGIAWPDVADPSTLSAKDRLHPLLADLPPHFKFEE